MALSHEILWREKERELADSIRPRLHQSGKLESSPSFSWKIIQESLFRSPSFFHSSIHLAGWLWHAALRDRGHLFPFCPLFRSRSYDCVRMMLPAAVSLFAPQRRPISRGAILPSSLPYRFPPSRFNFARTSRFRVSICDSADRAEQQGG